MYYISADRLLVSRIERRFLDPVKVIKVNLKEFNNIAVFTPLIYF